MDINESRQGRSGINDIGGKSDDGKVDHNCSNNHDKSEFIMSTYEKLYGVDLQMSLRDEKFVRKIESTSIPYVVVSNVVPRP